MIRFLILLAVLAPAAAHAQCVNPSAEMGTIIFNKAHKVMQYCNGDDWVGIWGGGGGSGSSTPSGAVMAFDLSACPEGWSEYLPARGRFVRGIDPNGTNDTVRIAGNVQADALGSHNHTGTAAAGGSHSHTGTAASAGAHAHSGTAASAGGHTHSGTTNSGGQHNHNYRFNNGQGGSNETFSTAGGRSGGTITGSSSSGIFPSGEHSHSFTTNTAGAHTHSLTIDSAGAHTHALTINNAGDHTHALTINATGAAETRPKNVALLYCRKD